MGTESEKRTGLVYGLVALFGASRLAEQISQGEPRIGIVWVIIKELPEMPYRALDVAAPLEEDAAVPSAGLPVLDGEHLALRVAVEHLQGTLGEPGVPGPQHPSELGLLRLIVGALVPPEKTAGDVDREAPVSHLYVTLGSRQPITS